MSGANPPLPGTLAAGLTPETHADLLASGSRRHFRTGASLFHQGDPSRHAAMIEKGWVKVTATSRGGWETLLAIRGPGDILGELSAIDGSPRLGTVTALTPLTVVVISGERLDDLLIRLPSVAVAMVRHLAARLRESDQRRMQYGATNGDARLTVLLVELLERHGRRTDDGYLIALPLSQQELASSVGLSREVVARTLRVLRDRGVVVTRRKQILVLRPDLLRSLARSVSMSTDPT